MATVFKHQADSHNASEKGEIAREKIIQALKYAYPGIQIEETNKNIDVRGADLLTLLPDGTTATYECTGHFDQNTAKGIPISEVYLRVPCGYKGDRVKSIFTSIATYWAFYNPSYNKSKVMVFTIKECREYIQRNYPGTDDTDNKAEAAIKGLLYERVRPTGRSDLFRYVPIERVIKYANVLSIPK